MSRLIVVLVCTSLLIAISGASAEEVGNMADGGLRVWVADPLVKILPDTPAMKSSGAIKVDAVRDEYESAQFVVTPNSDVAKLTVKVSPLTGPSKVVPRVEAHFLGFIHIEKGTPDTPDEYLIAKPPVDIPDVLMDARSVSVKAGMNQPVWLTVYVPKNTEPGRYKGTITVSAEIPPPLEGGGKGEGETADNKPFTPTPALPLRGGGGPIATLPIEVRVHPVMLPDERTLYLTNWFSPGNIAKFHGLEMWSEPWWKMLEAYARCMSDHRQNTVITPIMDLITVRYDSSGNRTFDFSRFDRWVELFKKAGVIGYIEGGHLGGRGVWEATDFDASRPTIINSDSSVQPNPGAKTASEEERQFLSWFMPALQKHLEEKGWIDIYFQHLADEPIPQNAESYKKLSSYVREYAPKLRIIDAAMCNQIAGSIDIWVPQPQHYENDIKFFTERKAAGDEIWFYTCLSPKGKYVNRFLDFQLIRTRLTHWVNFKYDLTGFLHWGFNYWRGDPWSDLQSDWLPPGDSHIVYPGKRGPMSSIRLEALRDGMEDFELLKLLEKKDAQKARAICDSVVRTMTDYTLDPSEFRRARMRLMRALE